MRTLALIGVLSSALSFGVDLPKQSPEFVVNFPSGEKQLLSKYRGKVVLLQFLFTTCPHCQHTAGVFSVLQNELGSRGLQVVGIAFNEMSPMLVPDFIRDFKPSFPIGWADRDHVLNYLGLTVSDRFVVPQEVLIDRKGVIRMMSPPLGDANMQDEKYMRVKIEELLGGPTHAHTTPVPAKAAARPVAAVH